MNITHITYLVEEDKNHGDVRVFVSGGHDVQVVVLDEGVSAVLGADQGRQRTVLFPVSDQAYKFVNDGVVDSAAVVTRYYDFTLHIQEVNCRQRHFDAEVVASSTSNWKIKTTNIFSRYAKFDVLTYLDRDCTTLYIYAWFICQHV